MTQATWHAQTADETARVFATNAAQGLTVADATARLARCGPNALAPAKTRSVLAISALAPIAVVEKVEAAQRLVAPGDVA